MYFRKIRVEKYQEIILADDKVVDEFSIICWITWRQDRDHVRSAQSNAALDPGGLLPRNADPVLGRALTLFDFQK